MRHKGWEIKHRAPKINPPFKILSDQDAVHPHSLGMPCCCECRGGARGCPGQDAVSGMQQPRSAQLWLTARPPLPAAGMTPCRSVRTLPSSSRFSHAAFDSVEGGWASGRCLPPPSAVTHPTEKLTGVPKQRCWWEGSVTEARSNYPSRN